MEMARILLIEPPVPENPSKVMRTIGSIGSLKAAVKYPPHDLTVLGGFLRKNGIDFEIIDALNLNYSWKRLKYEISKENPEAVVFTCTIPTLDNDTKVAEIAKEVNPEIKTIMINFLMETCKYNILERYKDVDFACIRDYEIPVLNLIKNNYDGRKVKGIYYRDNGRVVRNAGCEYCWNLDELGIPAHDKLPLKIYEDHIIKRKPMALVLCSRGCVNQCHHCTSIGLNPLRTRSVESVIEELRFLENLGVKEITFWDCELPFERNNTKQAWIKKFLRRIKEEGFDFTMSCNVRSDCINYEILKLMKSVGFHTLKLGADSCFQHILDNMNKNETVEEIERAAREIKELGFKLLTYCTLGHRGETAETMRATIKWVTHKLKPDFTTFSIAVPIKGTVFYNYLKEYGYLNEDAEGDPNAPPTYDYLGRMEKEGLPDLTSKEMYKIAMWGYRYFYLRPSYIVRRLLTTNNLLFDVKNGLYFILRYVFEPLKR